MRQLVKTWGKSEASASSEAGFAVVLTGLSMIVLVLVAGFGVDLGQWFLTASRLQRASDAAALAASSQLPNVTTATNAATDVYLRNGYKDGVNNITITTTVTATSVQTSARDDAVPTYFIKMIIPHIQLTRTSISQSSPTPLLGSPYNVLGTGDLKIPGLINPDHEGFWLAINGVCTPKEDGDFFDARYDHTRGPLTTPVGANHLYPATSSARTHCPVPPNNAGYPYNPDFTPGGYSYFVDVPKAPASAGPNPWVSVKIYDPTSNDTGNGVNYTAPDYVVTLPQDPNWWLMDTFLDIFDTNGTPNDPTDDTELIPHPYGILSTGDDNRYPANIWYNLATIQLTPAQAQNGVQLRVQLDPEEWYGQAPYAMNDPHAEGVTRGVNAFSIGAFASWENGGNIYACNADDDPSCPRVYARSAISVYNNLDSATNGSHVDIYLADITPQFVGQTYTLMLWDPGEGTQSVQIVAPDGTPLGFTYTSGGSFPGDVGPSSAGTVNSIDTTQTDSHAIDGATGVPTLSNNYAFNDRLIQISMTIPASYASHVSGNDNWLRLRYNVNSGTPNDRTTWGISSPGGASGGPPHLTQLG